MAHVAANIDAQVAADGAGKRVGGVRRSEEDASTADGAKALPDHADDRARGEVHAQVVVKLLGSEVAVVCLGLVHCWLEHLERNELVALVLEAANNFADEATLHAVGLDRDEGTLGLGRHWTKVDLATKRQQVK